MVTFRLHMNMRIHLHSSFSQEEERERTFAWLSHRNKVELSFSYDFKRRNGQKNAKITN